MYGIINKALEELVTETFGTEVWENIKIKSKIDVDYFISNQSYNDQITYDIAIAISEETKTPLNVILTLFGEWWILRTAKEKYGSLLSFGGKNIKEFLMHLPDFHTRVMLLYPHLTPPEFKVLNSEEKSIIIEYTSSRMGLQDFVTGLFQGISKLYDTQTIIEILDFSETNKTVISYKISW